MPDLANGDRWFDFEGARVYFQRHGAGEAIVFLPNATLTGRQAVSWRCTTQPSTSAASLRWS